MLIRKVFVVFIILLLLGCKSANPMLPNEKQDIGSNYIYTQSHRNLWGIFSFYINTNHSTIQVIPDRATNFHFNALKFLEHSPCDDCVSVANLTPVGDGIIDLDVSIRHPFNENLAYSGFDVKGIIMFTGSLEVSLGFLTYFNYPEIYPAHMSWWRLSDWELLNPDGYSYYWSPPFNPDSQLPITQYFPGKFAVGTPTATVNAYKDFYTDEERHLFRPGYEVTRTYRIKTQPGPMVVGYAVDACWEPPLVTPVSNPVTDFPLTANQPEPYHFVVDINNGEPFYGSQYLGPEEERIKLYIDQWNGLTVTRMDAYVAYEHPEEVGTEHINPGPKPLLECEKYNCGDNCYCGLGWYWVSDPDAHPEGWYRLIILVFGGSGANTFDHAVTVGDFLWYPD